MSSKSNPIGFRIKKNIKLDSQWYSHHNYSEILHDDLKIREIIQNFLLSRNIITNQIIIKRTKKRLLIFIYIYDTFYNAKKFCINKEIQKIIKNYTNIFEQKISLYLYNYSKIYTFDKPVVKNLILSYSYLKKKKNYNTNQVISSFPDFFNFLLFFSSDKGRTSIISWTPARRNRRRDFSKRDDSVSVATIRPLFPIIPARANVFPPAPAQ